jgi:hypothetical protein
MHGNSRPLLSATLACPLLGGCASLPQQKLDASADLQSKTVVVVPVGIPKNPAANLVSSSAASFGLVGGFFKGEIVAKHVKALNGILADQKFDFHAEVSNEVVQAAQKSAAKTVTPDVAGVARKKWILPIRRTPGADAYFDVYVTTFGYVASGDMKPYVPSVDLWARITDASGKQLFLTHIIYNPDLDVLHKAEGPKLTPDDEYQFASMDAIKADPAKAVAGLHAALAAVANELDRELHGPVTASAVAQAK